MNHQKAFLRVFGPKLISDGYIKKGNIFFHHMPDAQIIKFIHMDIYGGNNLFRIIADIRCYADEFDPKLAKYIITNDMDIIIPAWIGRQRRPFTVFTDDVEDQLQDRLREFQEVFYPVFMTIDSVEKCYDFRKRITRILTGRPMGRDLLFESFQCGLYDETLEYAQIDYKQVQKEYYANKARDNAEGIIRLEGEMDRCQERINALKTRSLGNLNKELEERIKLSECQCREFFGCGEHSKYPKTL